MIRLPSPVDGDTDEQIAICCSEILDEIKNHSRADTRKRVMREKTTIEERVAEYVRSGGNPEKLGQSPFRASAEERKSRGKKKGTVGDLLRRRYQSGGKTDRDIVARANEVATSHCPYCSLPLALKAHGRSNDRDHVLPKSDFPEFSLLSVNLVVACDACNEAKKAKYMEDGHWCFVHPYFDGELGQTLLEAVVLGAGKHWTIQYRIVGGVPSGFRDRLDRHISNMDIFRRYLHHPLSEVTREIERLKDMMMQLGLTVAQVRKILSSNAAMELRKRANDPVGLALAALSRSPLLPGILS